MGVGLAADEPIKAGELVLRLPKAAWYPVSAELALSQARQRVPQFVTHAEAVSRQLAGLPLARSFIRSTQKSGFADAWTLRFRYW